MKYILQMNFINLAVFPLEALFMQHLRKLWEYLLYIIKSIIKTSKYSNIELIYSYLNLEKNNNNSIFLNL